MDMADSQYQPSDITAIRGTEAFVLDLGCWSMLQIVDLGSYISNKKASGIAVSSRIRIFDVIDIRLLRGLELLKEERKGEHDI
jgi:hypothetical protein